MAFQTLGFTQDHSGSLKFPQVHSGILWVTRFHSGSHLGSPGYAWVHFGSLGFTRVLLGSFGLTPVHSGFLLFSRRFTWIDSGSLGVTRVNLSSHLGSLRYTLVHLEFTMVNSSSLWFTLVPFGLLGLTIGFLRIHTVSLGCWNRVQFGSLELI